MTTEPLTRRQAEVLAYLIAFAAERGYTPTIREQCRAFGVSHPEGAACIRRELRRKGYITWEPGLSRTIRILRTPEGNPCSGVLAK
jgi:repressor LexA